MKPVLSVVTPIYNGSEYAENLIKLLKENQHSGVEFVVVDDGSRDNTAQLMEKLSEGMDNFRLIKKENGGVSTARNKGIECAEGEYIWFVDADDGIEPGSVERICKFVSSGADFYIFDAKAVTGEKELLLESFEKKEGFVQHEGSAELMMENLMTNTHTNAVWNKVFKSSIIKEEGISFPVGIINGEDTMFLLDYCDKIKSMEYIKESLYIYVLRQGSAANNIRPETVKGFVPVYSKKISYCEKYGLKAIEEQIRKGFVNKMLRAFFHIKRNKKVDNKSLKECIKTVVSDEFIRAEFEKQGNVFKGTVKTYYKMHMKKNVNGIYRLVSMMAFAYGIKRLIKK